MQICPNQSFLGGKNVSYLNLTHKDSLRPLRDRSKMRFKMHSPIKLKAGWLALSILGSWALTCLVLHQTT